MAKKNKGTFSYLEAFNYMKFKRIPIDLWNPLIRLKDIQIYQQLKLNM